MSTKESRVSGAELRRYVSGDVFGAGDDGYEERRLAWDRNVDQHPALILIPNDVRDVAAGVRFARDARLGIAVQATGHGLQRPADGALLILTSRLNTVEVDAEARTARVSAGAVWQDVLERATPHGLAPLLGSSPHVGVVGYTLGGGIGWLARRFGLAVDSVRSLELVPADAVPRRVSATENGDLFWALRGGGGNFGVVTAIDLNLVALPDVYGGSLAYSAADAGKALRFYREWVKTVPDELTSSLAIVKFPSRPFIPEALRGQTQVVLRAVYAGPERAGASLMKSWTDWQTPLANSFRQLPFREIGSVSNDPVDPVAATGSNEMLDELSEAAVDRLARIASDTSSPLLICELRHAGGAIARAPAEATAIDQRSATFYLQVGGLTPTRAAYSAVEEYIARLKAELAPYVRGSVYLSFMKGEEARRRVKDAYPPATYERLVALKHRHDPDNLFRFSYALAGAT